MPKLNDLKSEITSIYKNAPNSIARFNVLNEIENLIRELRSTGVELALKPEINSEDDFIRIRNILLDQAGILYKHADDTLIQLDSTFNDIIEKLAFDSLDSIEFIMAVEESFEVELPDYDLECLSSRNCTLQEFIKFVKEKQ